MIGDRNVWGAIRSGINAGRSSPYLVISTASELRIDVERVDSRGHTSSGIIAVDPAEYIVVVLRYRTGFSHQTCAIGIPMGIHHDIISHIDYRAECKIAIRIYRTPGISW